MNKRWNANWRAIAWRRQSNDTGPLGLLPTKNEKKRWAAEVEFYKMHKDQIQHCREFNPRVNNRQVRRAYARVMDKRARRVA